MTTPGYETGKPLLFLRFWYCNALKWICVLYILASMLGVFIVWFASARNNTSLIWRRVDSGACAKVFITTPIGILFPSTLSGFQVYKHRLARKVVIHCLKFIF